MDALVIRLLLCRARKDNILVFTINADYPIRYKVFISSQKWQEILDTGKYYRLSTSLEKYF